MSKQQRVERLRSRLAMSILDELQRQNLVRGSAMHCGGSIFVTVHDVGQTTIGVLVDSLDPLSARTQVTNPAAQALADQVLATVLERSFPTIAATETVA